MRVFCVLMWKHVVVRLRRFIHTSVEIVSPLLFFLLIYFLGRPLIESISGLDPSKQQGSMTDDIIPIADIEPKPYWLMYYPVTPLTNQLMAAVGAKLQLPKLPSNRDFKKQGYFPLPRKSKLIDIVPKMKTTQALLIFKGLSGGTMPSRLTYTIRMKGDFHTEVEKLQDSPPSETKKRKTFNFQYGTFMIIQWAVDSSYIKLLTGAEIPEKLSLQPFPTTPNTRMGAFIICILLSITCWLSLMLTFVYHMSRLLQERASGIQELMKMVGVSLNTLGFCHYLNVLPIGIIFAVGGAVICKISDKPMIPETSGILIGLMLFLYFNSVIAFACVCSYISRGTQYAVTLSALVYAVSYMPARYIGDREMRNSLRLLTGLLPHMPMKWFWYDVGTMEFSGKGANFSTIQKKHRSDCPPIILGFLFMILQTLICYVLAWYLALVRPGQYGQALPWNFPCVGDPEEKKILEKKKKEEDDRSETDFSVVPPNTYTRPYYEVRRVTVTRDADRKKSDYTLSDEDAESEYDEEEEEEEEEDAISVESRFFEPGPPHSEAGIEVICVSKVYPKHKALKKVSLEVYKGEITVLLGRNGAGKTTLMSIITGMTSATEGRVLVNGKDTVTEKDEVRKNMGHCPQHNLFFDDLTVRQHIMFFTMLKRGSYFKARRSARELAAQLGLSEKLGSLPSKLSGGMKRRAQLACALAGGADVLVLDEPTSGLDVETRRGLWDLLLSLRGQRTVLITTHFMEEADALGDRVAALHSGVLRCFATPMHLKKEVGTGYRLTLTTVGPPNEPKITKVVTSHVPEAVLKEHTNNSLTYALPSSSSDKFSKLFSTLETKKSKLEIDSIGVGVSTLEEVFLKLCSDIDPSIYDDESEPGCIDDSQPDRLTGIRLYTRQFCVLLKRQVKYAIYKRWAFLFLQLIIPIAIICLITTQTNKIEEGEMRALPMTLEQFDPPNIILYRLGVPHVDQEDDQEPHFKQNDNGDSDDTQKDKREPHVTQEDINKAQATWHPRAIFVQSDDVIKTVLEVSKKGTFEEKLYLAGIECDNEEFKVLSSSSKRHAAPVALNLMSNLLAAHYIPGSTGHSITTINDPVERAMSAVTAKEPKDLTSVVTWGICLVFIILATNINNISLPCKGRETGARHIHIMSGCPIKLHWLATLTFHMLCSSVLIIATVLACYYLDKDETFSQPDMLGALALILFVGCMAFLALSYLVSLNFGERGTSILLVAAIVIFGFSTAPSKVLSDLGVRDDQTLNEDPDSPSNSYFLFFASILATPHVVSETALKCLNVGRINAWCDLARERCPASNILIDDVAFDAEECCINPKPRCYYCVDEFSPLLGIYLLLLHFLFFMTLVIMTERGVFKGLLDKCRNKRYKSAQPPETDALVREEKAYVSKAINLPRDRIPDAMLVDDLHKNYVPCCRKKVNAIKGVSFSVKKGECFGLLGVNGAGKSTCFKMMTAEECPTRGKIFANGYFLRRENDKYLQTLGYCPQFFGLDMFQTGEENLAMVLTLRGFNSEDVEEEVQNWIEIVGLEKYAQQLVESYSGGCVRRLGTASALCGGAQLALLDEPTAGVDVAARRRLWTALRRALRSQRAVVITSHSMDEMEALCSRIAILAGGRVRALGTAAALRAAHAQGHAVIFKIKHALPGDDVAGARAQLDQLKAKMQEKFNCTLKDEHKTMLHYHINETMQYSTLFAGLETLRLQFSTLIEDYSVTETTLEEVFLAFAKEQQSVGIQAV